MPNQRRVLLKLSGEILGRDSHYFCEHRLDLVINALKAALDQHVQIAIVIGGGNIVRGADVKLPGVHATTADQMGMLATMMNGLLLRDVLQSNHISVALYGAKALSGVVVPLNRHKAIDDLNAGKIVICAGGTGNPCVTTDTAAALRAVELSCDVVLKATKVDGVYDKDPVQFNDANRYEKLTFDEVIDKQLCVMDLSAFELCQEHQIDVSVFNVLDAGILEKALLGENVGTLVYNPAKH